jgi:hypothetical protein
MSKASLIVVCGQSPLMKDSRHAGGGAPGSTCAELRHGPLVAGGRHDLGNRPLSSRRMAVTYCLKAPAGTSAVR